MSIKKIAKTTAIVFGGTVAGVVGIAGYAAYKIIHGTKHFVVDFYHQPSLKKVAAVAVIPFAIYGIRHPVGAVEGASKAFQNTGTYISETVDNWNDARVDELGKKLEEKESEIDLLESQNKNLEKIVYSDGKKSSSAKLAKNNSIDKYLARFAGDFQNLIHVDKDKNVLHLLRSNGKSYVEIEQYNCTSGKNKLPKTMNGDLASPEGIFYASPEREQWNPKYTPAKLNLAIPEPMGSGIVVTGTSDPDLNNAIQKHESASNGGIILSSHDYLELHSKIGSDRVIPVVISSQRTKTLLDYTGGGK